EGGRMGVRGGGGGEGGRGEGRGIEQPEDLSRDGRYLAFTSTTQWPDWDIWLLPLQGGDPIPWLRTPASESSPRFSPDGRWIAYESYESGATEIYVARTDAAGDRRRISLAGGEEPRGRADGRGMYYIGSGGVGLARPGSPA